MTNELPKANKPYIALVCGIVSGYVSNNHISAAELPTLIATVHIAMSVLTRGGAASVAAQPETDKPTEAQIRKSLSKDALVSFVDGKSYKTLKRHLTAHGLTPETYRAQFGLPSDYPMVAPSYSEKRSNLARSMGLGIQRSRYA